jgi:micrococcal nuclease
MKRWIKYGVIVVFGGLSAFGYSSATLTSKQSAVTVGSGWEIARVGRVIDGDTIELADKRTVRYIGIDSPETVNPRKTGVQCFSAEAKRENQRLVEGKLVRLAGDVSDTDKYGRLLRYVYSDDVFVNDHLVRMGFARAVAIMPDIAYRDAFYSSQKSARQKSLGLWKNCPMQ